MVITSSPDNAKPVAVGSPPYNAESLFPRAHRLAALISLCATSRRTIFVRNGEGFRCLRECEIGAVRPKTLAEHLGLELPTLATWLRAALADGYILRVSEPPVFTSAGTGSTLIIIKASCLGVAWLGSWRSGKAL